MREVGRAFVNLVRAHADDHQETEDDAPRGEFRHVYASASSRADRAVMMSNRFM